MTKFVVIFGFLMAFVAGLIVGVSRPQHVATSGANTGPTTRQGRDRGSELDTLLKLRPEQKEQMKTIWSEVADKGRKHHEHRRDELRDERDAKVQALFSPEPRSRYEQIQQEYDDQRKALEREMRANFDQAVKETEAILDPDQLVKYREWHAKRMADRNRGGDRGRDRGRGGGGDRDGSSNETTRRSDARATSAPSNQP